MQKHIFLIRHGESTANLDLNRYHTDKDHNVPLTQFGYEQTVNAGKFLKQFFEEHPELKSKKVRIYYSPYLRTRQTMEGVFEGAGDLLSDKKNIQFREEMLLRERESAVFPYLSQDQRKPFSSYETDHYQGVVEKGGTFYARPPRGESYADTTLRTEVFKDKMLTSMARNDIEVAIVISHKNTLECFEKAFFHKDIDWLNNLPNFPNAGIKLIKQKPEKGYTNDLILENNQRSKHLPKDYKTRAFGVSEEVNKISA
jgi:2,3-bisphosphoglycerate-dependent phosphoglycerate mutase